eukprot:TRINITY_DN1999_c0_g1_i2.p1 TRINITY_DN1999_c0_g1~~TRINITY_DN1999_c0_g1_i2.p1  ORF type:complete len:381 (+),score=70.65 TRINITY_DN1999_c0_g1_i2:45-1187(+)
MAANPEPNKEVPGAIKPEVDAEAPVDPPESVAAPKQVQSDPLKEYFTAMNNFCPLGPHTSKVINDCIRTEALGAWKDGQLSLSAFSEGTDLANRIERSHDSMKTLTLERRLRHEHYTVAKRLKISPEVHDLLEVVPVKESSRDALAKLHERYPQHFGFVARSAGQNPAAVQPQIQSHVSGIPGLHALHQQLPNQTHQQQLPNQPHQQQLPNQTHQQQLPNQPHQQQLPNQTHQQQLPNQSLQNHHQPPLQNLQPQLQSHQPQLQSHGLGSLQNHHALGAHRQVQHAAQMVAPQQMSQQVGQAQPMMSVQRMQSVQGLANSVRTGQLMAEHSQPVHSAQTAQAIALINQVHPTAGQPKPQPPAQGLAASEGKSLADMFGLR